MGSAVQQVAMQCWCLTFQPQDHSFLIQSNVFANISKALSGVDGTEESEETKIKDKVNHSQWHSSVVMAIFLLLFSFVIGVLSHTLLPIDDPSSPLPSHQ